MRALIIALSILMSNAVGFPQPFNSELSMIKHAETCDSLIVYSLVPFFYNETGTVLEPETVTPFCLAIPKKSKGVAVSSSTVIVHYGKKGEILIKPTVKIHQDGKPVEERDIKIMTHLSDLQLGAVECHGRRVYCMIKSNIGSIQIRCKLSELPMFLHHFWPDAPEWFDEELPKIRT